MQKFCELIIESQQGDKKSTETLIQQFYPLIKSASRQLKGDDAVSELQFFLFTIIQTIDLAKMKSTGNAAIATYLKKAIYHQVAYSLRKAAKENICKYYEDLSDFEKSRYEAKSSTHNNYNGLFIEDLKKVLNKREQFVVDQLYFNLFTVAETAASMGISRQAVNSIQLSALKKLRKAYDET